MCYFSEIEASLIVKPKIYSPGLYYTIRHNRRLGCDSSPSADIVCPVAVDGGNGEVGGGFLCRLWVYPKAFGFKAPSFIVFHVPDMHW